MMMIRRLLSPLSALAALAAAALLTACDPLAPFPTPTALVMIVTPQATATLPPTDTPPPTRTPTPAPTSTAPPTATPDPCTLESGTVIPFDDFRSEIAGENLRYRVYVPPCYLQAQRRYPVVYLLHGLQQDETLWERIGMPAALEQGMRMGALGPMILVMPFSGRIGTADAFPPDPSLEGVLLDELMPAVERDFCTINNRQHRAIAGISRGGFWAFSIAMRRPDLFSRVAGHSAYLDAENVPAASAPLSLASNDAFLPDAGLAMFLDNAAADPAGTTIELFSSRLSARGIAHRYIIYPEGDHNEAYWSSHVSEYLDFYGADWPATLDALPSCMEPSP
jgi:enterochelin esterase-like enzyme